MEGHKVLLHGLEEFARKVPEVVQDGLSEIIDRVQIEAIANLRGPRRTTVRLLRNKETGKISKFKSGRKKYSGRGASNDLGAKPGSYPVPRTTSNLLRLLDRVKPGRSKQSNGLTFKAGYLEAIIFNSAEYADVIHSGTRSSKKFGPRPYIMDAVETVTPEMAHIMSKRLMERVEII